MPVRCEIADHVARVTIDRPEVLNAVDAPTEAELQAIWLRLEASRDVRVIVLTGTGERAFCTGADMKGGSGVSGLEYWAKARPGGFGGIALRESLDIPVIARVNGHALGGGFEMMLGCDIVVAAEEATFGLPEPRVGRLPLDGGMTLLQRQIRNQASRPSHVAFDCCRGASGPVAGPGGRAPVGRQRRRREGLCREAEAALDGAISRLILENEASKCGASRIRH